MLLARERQGYPPDFDTMPPSVMFSGFSSHPVETPPTAYIHPPVSTQTQPQEGYIPAYPPVDVTASPAVTRSNTRSPYHHLEQGDNPPPRIADGGIPNNAHILQPRAQRPELHRGETFPVMSYHGGDIDLMSSLPVGGNHTHTRYSVPSSIYQTPTSTMTQVSWPSPMPRTPGQYFRQ